MRLYWTSTLKQLIQILKPKYQEGFRVTYDFLEHCVRTMRLVNGSKIETK